MRRRSMFFMCLAMAFPLIAIEYNGEDVTSKTQTIIVGQKANLSVKKKIRSFFHQDIYGQFQVLSLKTLMERNSRIPIALLPFLI